MTWPRAYIARVNQSTVCSNASSIHDYLQQMNNIVKNSLKLPFYHNYECFHVAKAVRRISKTFPMNYRWSRLVVFLLTYPHLLKRRQRSEYRATDPDRVLPLGRGDDFHFVGGRRQRGDLSLHPIGDTGEHRGSAGENDVGV